MLTISELYARADYPDLAHWKDMPLFSIAQLGLLTVGIDPLLYEDLEGADLITILKHDQPVNWKNAIMIFRCLQQDICVGNINCQIVNIHYYYECTGLSFRRINQIDLKPDDCDLINIYETKISRAESRAWLKRNGYLENPIKQYQEEGVEKLTSLQEARLSSVLHSTYTTPALNALKGVIQEFWSSYDPDNNQPYPKQSVVETWIKENYPEIKANDICKYIDKICRHPKAKKGGNTRILNKV
ncbi:hypothetical protein [Acinetobacter sp.]|uniref:hypothetical protein n=1 Tax=Acinetobacter sp. TaxID=472 RepID=UPI00388E80DD